MKRTIFISSLALAAGIAGMSDPAIAQDGAQASSEAPGSDIVVTARRRDERLQDVPVAVTALGGAALRSANVVQVQESSRRFRA